MASSQCNDWETKNPMIGISIQSLIDIAKLKEKLFLKS
jgi:hypothetical protein